jgi:hypothetical protein
MVMIKTWNSQTNTIEEALDLPKGSYAANFGFLVEQSVNPEHVLEAAEAIKNHEINAIVASQAGLICKAQELGVAFQDWAELKTF